MAKVRWVQVYYVQFVGSQYDRRRIYTDIDRKKVYLKKRIPKMDRIFAIEQTGLPALTCPKCIELSNISGEELIKRIKDGKL